MSPKGSEDTLLTPRVRQESSLLTALASQQLRFRPVRVFDCRHCGNNCRAAKAINEHGAGSSSRLASPGLILALQAVQNQGRAWGFLPATPRKGWRRQKHNRGTLRDRMSPALRLLLSGTQTACEAEPHAAFAGPRCVLQRPRRLPVVFSADLQCCLAGFGSGSSFFFSVCSPRQCSAVLRAMQGSCCVCTQLSGFPAEGQSWAAPFLPLNFALTHLGGGF